MNSPFLRAAESLDQSVKDTLQLIFADQMVIGRLDQPVKDTIFHDQMVIYSLSASFSFAHGPTMCRTQHKYRGSLLVTSIFSYQSQHQQSLITNPPLCSTNMLRYLSKFHLARPSRQSEGHE